MQSRAPWTLPPFSPPSSLFRRRRRRRRSSILDSQEHANPTVSRRAKGWKRESPTSVSSRHFRSPIAQATRKGPRVRLPTDRNADAVTVVEYPLSRISSGRVSSRLRNNASSTLPPRLTTFLDKSRGRSYKAIEYSKEFLTVSPRSPPAASAERRGDSPC